MQWWMGDQFQEIQKRFFYYTLGIGHNEH